MSKFSRFALVALLIILPRQERLVINGSDPIRIAIGDLFIIAFSLFVVFGDEISELLFTQPEPTAQGDKHEG